MHQRHQLQPVRLCNTSHQSYAAPLNARWDRARWHMFKAIPLAKHTQRCASCGALYDVIAVDKKHTPHNERVVCTCGWPLKDWIGFKAYLFTRRSNDPECAEV